MVEALRAISSFAWNWFKSWLRFASERFTLSRNLTLRFLFTLLTRRKAVKALCTGQQLYRPAYGDNKDIAVRLKIFYLKFYN